MNVWSRAVGLYLALLAVAVSAQFTLFRIYAPLSDRAEQTSNAIWQVLGWCQLIGMVLILVATFKAKRYHAADPQTSIPQWITVNVLFYASVLFALTFLPIWLSANWGEALPDDAFWMIWYVIDVAGPVLFATVGIRLWTFADSDSRAP